MWPKRNENQLVMTREHWLVDPNAEAAEQYESLNNQYHLLLQVNAGAIGSRVVSGFEIPVRAIFDSKENLAALRRLMSVDA